MTIQEKVGQLQQCGPSLVGAFEVSFEELLDMMFDGKISEAEFGRLMSTAEEDFYEKELKKGMIGSYNGIKNAATANKLQKIAIEETRLGIPLLFGYDVIHGYRTIMPIPLAESCTWDEKIWEKTARIAAEEATSAGIHMTFAPMVDVSKDARWGRISEGAGEDSYIVSLFGVAKIRGFQTEGLSREDALVACVKHFAAYGAAEARAIMPAFNDINGVPCSVNKWLLLDLLRKKWGFNGVTVSDANAIAECVDHGCAEDKKDASRQAIAAGIDIDMSSNSYVETLVDLVEDGTIQENVLDNAVADVLRIKFELGLFEQPYQTSEIREKETLLKEEYRKVAREVAGKSMVLLKNENVLPLKEGTKVAIIGGLANSDSEMTGAWAIGAKAEDCVSLVAACEQQNIDYIYTSDIKNIDENIVNCDVIIVALGEKKDQSGEAASRSDISISTEQIILLEKLKETGKPVVVILFNGRPLALGEVSQKATAILEAWHPGVEAGNAILDILFGIVNPSAKLTTTFPYASGQCPMYYGHINTGRPGGKGKFTSKYLDAPIEPVYPFGYGLSYTSYEYCNLEVTEKEDAFEASVVVKNTGDIEGEEIVQCYIRDRVAQRVRPIKQLMAFEKIRLESGQEKVVRFNLKFERLGYYNSKMDYIVEEGEFDIFIGKNVNECLQIKVKL